MNKYKRGSFDERVKKIMWVLENETMFKGIKEHQTNRIKDIIITMKDHGLYSKTTWNRDINIVNLYKDTKKFKRRIGYIQGTQKN